MTRHHYSINTRCKSVKIKGRTADCIAVVVVVDDVGAVEGAAKYVASSVAVPISLALTVVVG